MAKALDEVIKRAVVKYCQDYDIVRREKLEPYVQAQVRLWLPFDLEPGHTWCVLKHLVSIGCIEGMVEGDVCGVSKARLNPPRKRVFKEKVQMGFGWGE